MEDFFHHENATYIRLYAKDPTCLERSIPCRGGFWYHADDDCGGDIYIGDNCHLLCRKCMKVVPLNIVGWASPYSVPDISDNLISFDGNYRKIYNPLSISGQGICNDKVGLIWLNKFVKAAIDQYDNIQSV